MTGYTLTGADERKLVGVNARLVAVVRAVAASGVKFVVSEGVRTKARQRQLVALGKSKTMNSKHLIGRAVDCYPLGVGAVQRGERDWRRSDFTVLVDAARRESQRLGIPLEFGYDWGWDSPHWEMKER